MQIKGVKCFLLFCQSNWQKLEGIIPRFTESMEKWILPYSFGGSGKNFSGVNLAICFLKNIFKCVYLLIEQAHYYEVKFILKKSSHKLRLCT